MMERAVSERLALAKRELTDIQYAIWFLRVVREIPAHRVAIMRGVSEPYVRQTVTRANQKIQIAIEREAA